MIAPIVIGVVVGVGAVLDVALKRQLDKGDPRCAEGDHVPSVIEHSSAAGDFEVFCRRCSHRLGE